METRVVERNGSSVAVVKSGEVVIGDVQSALDFLASIEYETGCSRIALNKEALTEEFFVLSTRLAGEILQKFVNYRVKLAVYGDFSRYTSRPLMDFIYESNRGNDIFFAPTEESAVERLLSAKE